MLRIGAFLHCEGRLNRSGTDPHPAAYWLGSILRRAEPLRVACGNIRPYEIVWWLFAACIVLGNVRYFSGELSGPLNYLTAYGGAGGCALAWLLARALFRSEAALTKWPLYLVGATVLIEGSWLIVQGQPAAGDMARLVANASSLVCIAMLALVFVEALSGFSRQLPVAERRFRQIFVGFFCVALTVTMVWALNAPEGSLAAESEAAADLAFGLIALVGGRYAVEYRKQNALSVAAAPARKTPRAQAPDPAFADLAGRIRHAFENKLVFTTPQLKVSQLSLTLGEPEYKVTQCITGVMGYRNFSRLVNAYRIEHAKAALRDGNSGDQQILAIALECGFNSIGPFNRAFKRETGMTPREYRAGRR